MIVTIPVGSATVAAITDTEQAYDAAGVYPEVTAEQWAPYRDALTPDGKVLLHFCSYLIRADGQTVLVDTGWGPGFNGALMQNLAAAGVQPEDVDAVVYTHLHGDHIGWNLIREDGDVRPRFPRARYLAPEADWRHYAAMDEPPQLFREQMLPLEGLGALELIGGDYVVGRSVTSLATPGHTPGHLSFTVTSAGEHCLILGDVAITPVEAHETDWENRFDWDRRMAKRIRHATLNRLEQDGALVAANHFPNPGFGRFVRRDGRRVWQPLTVE
jgi:glyoxylase-like metal-dependent hydrolase (beta-lactamase superfamily II)